jgi:hypothetical protein
MLYILCVNVYLCYGCYSVLSVFLLIFCDLCCCMCWALFFFFSLYSLSHVIICPPYYKIHKTLHFIQFSSCKFLHCFPLVFCFILVLLFCLLCTHTTCFSCKPMHENLAAWGTASTVVNSVNHYDQSVDQGNISLRYFVKFYTEILGCPVSLKLCFTSIQIILNFYL